MNPEPLPSIRPYRYGRMGHVGLFFYGKLINSIESWNQAAPHAAGASGGPVSAVDTGVPATCHDDAFHSDTACRDGPGFPPLHLDTWVPKP